MAQFFRDTLIFQLFRIHLDVHVLIYFHREFFLLLVSLVLDISEVVARVVAPSCV